MHQCCRPYAADRDRRWDLNAVVLLRAELIATAGGAYPAALCSMAPAPRGVVVATSRATPVTRAGVHR